ncbi:MAG: WavE lipopolysaccharide synthesis family protein [Desulfovibrio sp.]|jgi:hypothetical protein|nr:WavE lipopolysaccharide synthesis family protein [Desulfovibrio sp.]
MKCSLIIHGPYCDEWLDAIDIQLQKSKFIFTDLILVSYLYDQCLFEKKIKTLSYLNNKIKFLFIKDTINPGFFNINRQVLCMQAGLNLVKHDQYIIKLRIDQVVNFNKVYLYLESLNREKILTTCCFTRKDRLYHPSDMFLCGTKQKISEYFSLPIQQTNLNILMQNIYEIELNTNLTYIPISPESILFRHFLQKKQWNIMDTHEDYFHALHKFFYIVNSWDIDLKWKKKRTYILGGGNIILPHFFATVPFPGGPVERARCYLRHELTGSIPNIKDIYYISLAWLLWYLWPENYDSKFFNSKSNRILWLLKKTKRFYLCIQQNGIKYTLKLFIRKCIKKLTYYFIDT